MNFNEKIAALSGILDLDYDAENVEQQRIELMRRFREDEPDNAAILDRAKAEAGSQAATVYLRGVGPACCALRVRLGEWCGRNGIEFPGAAMIRARVGRSAMAVSSDGKIIQTIAEQTLEVTA